MTAALCRAKSCRPEDFGGPREVESDRPLCRVCADRLGGNLRRLAEMWPDLRERVALEGRAGEKVTGTKLPGLVINDEVSTLGTEVSSWVLWLARYVLDAHSTAQRPPDEFDVPTLLAWLAKWHAWRLAYSSDHDLAVDIVDWTAFYRGEVRRLAYPSNSRRVDIPNGRCPVTDDGQRCAGHLFAIIRDSGSALPSEIICDLNDEHTIPHHQWLQYIREISGANK